MPYDANLVLRGVYPRTSAGVYVDLEDGESSPTTLAVDTYGQAVVDLGPHGTDVRGMDCVVIFHDSSTGYIDYLDIQICDSDHIAGGWELLLEFPRIYPYTREIVGTATTAFTAAADFGVDLSEGAATYDGHIVAFSRELLVVGGTGKIWVAMQDAGDTYATSGDTLTSDGGGVATQVGASRLIQQDGFTMVRRFSTPRRYLRCTCTANETSADANFGDVDIMVTGSQHNHVNNLYR